MTLKFIRGIFERVFRVDFSFLIVSPVDSALQIVVIKSRIKILLNPTKAFLIESP